MFPQAGEAGKEHYPLAKGWKRGVGMKSLQCRERVGCGFFSHFDYGVKGGNIIALDLEVLIEILHSFNHFLSLAKYFCNVALTSYAALV
ncbi:hypothetical protein TNCV_1586271 [Trichonephila clavipes]|nr:hypothetical protein TNCV_1586271 [Trichonephila clavipes]